MDWLFSTARQTTRVLRFAIGLIMAALVAIVLWGVFARFVLRDPSWWSEEAARLLLIWLTMLGAAAASASRDHLGVDYFVNLLHPDARRLLELTGEFVVVAFSAAVLVYGGSVLVVETLRANQLAPALGVIGLKMGYAYLAVPLGGLGLILFSVVRIVELLRDNASTPGNQEPEAS